MTPHSKSIACKLSSIALPRNEVILLLHNAWCSKHGKENLSHKKIVIDIEYLRETDGKISSFVEIFLPFSLKMHVMAHALYHLSCDTISQQT